MDATPDLHADAAPRWGWLPAPGTWKYYALLGATGIFVLGPLGGLAASYMNFSLGFFVGGQVLAGILGSAVTFGYGAQGRHGANRAMSRHDAAPRSAPGPHAVTEAAGRGCRSARGSACRRGWWGKRAR